MFSFFGTIAAYLGYINLSLRLKNQIYTILASLGNFYLLYVAYRFFINGFMWRALLFIAAFLVIAYFAYLNFLYYFTNKKSRFDISPKIERFLGIEAKDPLSEIKPNLVNHPGFIQTNGLFEHENLLPATVKVSLQQQENLSELVKKLQALGYVNLNYGNQDEKTLLSLAQQQKQPLYALTPIALPYFELKETPTGIYVYGGINQLEVVQLAQLKTIGLLEAKAALQEYDLFLATVVVNQGPYRLAGRAGLMPEHRGEYGLDIKVAYRNKPSKKL